MKKLLLFISICLISYNSFSQSIIESNNRFSFDIYQKIKSKNENIIFSPVSITSAFAMTYVGAKNVTFNEIADVFYFNTNKSIFNSSYKNLFEDKLKGKPAFYNANSLWIQKDLELNPDFLSINKEYYSSSIHFSDFLNDSESSRLNINRWVEKNTNGKITNLLQPSSIDNTTRLVLINALYFKASWKKQFKKEKNTEAQFQIAKRDFVNTTFMNNSINTWYYEDKYAQVIDIPYSDENISLMIILPKSLRKLRKLEKNLNYDYYKKYIENKQKMRVKLSIPKFNIESDFDLNKTLQSLGIKNAFSSSANFSGISVKEKLYISKVIHKAKIRIDEEGTEAAAATAVIMRKTSMMLENVEFIANKPFIYILRNNETNCIYFMGKILNPKK